MRYLFLLLPFTALAIDPSLPVVRLDSGEIVERRQSIPTRYGSTVNYQSAGFNMWYADGWRQAAISQVTNVTTVEIPQAIQQVGNAYKTALESIYGEGAETNRALTKAAVAIDLSLRQDITAETGIRLQAWFEILNEYWGKGEVWTFPYGEESYSVTNVTEIWEAVP